MNTVSNKKRQSKYYPFDMFVKVCREKKIFSFLIYVGRYKEDPKFPPNPYKEYRKTKEWNASGWLYIKSNRSTLFPPDKKFYSFDEFKTITKGKFKNLEEYLTATENDLCLPPNPRGFYGGQKYKSIGSWKWLQGRTSRKELSRLKIKKIETPQNKHFSYFSTFGSQNFGHTYI